MILGTLGRALTECAGIELHAFCFLSNHFHLLLTVRDGAALAQFMNHLNSNVARKVGKLFGWSGRFWSRRYRAIEVLDAEAMEARLEYVLGQGVKEGLVASPHDWTGATSLRANLYGKSLRGTWINETDRWWARRRGEDTRVSRFEKTYRVAIAPLPCWRSLSVEQQRRKVREMVRRTEASAPKKVLGVPAILRKHPHDMPKNTARSKAPVCHASSRERRKAYRDEVMEQTLLYRTVSIRVRRGDLAALHALPAYFFPPRLSPRLSSRPSRIPRARR